MKRLLAGALAALIATPAAADTLVENVKGITLNARGEVVRFTGLVIGRDGRIARLIAGSEAQTDRAQRKKPKKNPPPETFDARLDGQGKVLLPGLIDAHGHVMELGFQQLTLDLSDTRSLAEAQAKIDAYARANPNRKWILGRG